MTQGIDYSSYNNIKRLSDAELEALWQKFFNDKTSKRLRDELIMQYLYLVRYVVNRVNVKLPSSFTIEDIMAYGVEGLIYAVEKYAPSQIGAKFETYAIVRIRGSILDRIRSQDFVPRSARKRIRDLKIVAERLKEELGRVPTSSEIANVMGISAQRVDEILADDTTVTSIYEKKICGDESLEIIDTIEDKRQESLDNIAEDKDTKKELEDALKRLPERERMILVLYYHQNLTLKEIGDIVEISESRVCQLHALALMKLKNILSQEKTDRLNQSIIKEELYE